MRQQFADILADYGLTVPQAFKLFANQVIKTGVVPLSFDWKNSQVKRVPSSLDFDIKEIESKSILFEKRKSIVLNELEKGNGIRASTEMMKILKENGCSDYAIKCLKTALNINSKGKLTLNGKTVNVWKIGV